MRFPLKILHPEKFKWNSDSKVNIATNTTNELWWRTHDLSWWIFNYDTHWNIPSHEPTQLWNISRDLYFTEMYMIIQAFHKNRYAKTSLILLLWTASLPSKWVSFVVTFQAEEPFAVNEQNYVYISLTQITPALSFADFWSQNPSTKPLVLRSRWTLKMQQKIRNKKDKKKIWCRQNTMWIFIKILMIWKLHESIRIMNSSV